MTVMRFTMTEGMTELGGVNVHGAMDGQVRAVNTPNGFAILDQLEPPPPAPPAVVPTRLYIGRQKNEINAYDFHAPPAAPQQGLQIDNRGQPFYPGPAAPAPQQGAPQGHFRTPTGRPIHSLADVRPTDRFIMPDGCEMEVQVARRIGMLDANLMVPRQSDAARVEGNGGSLRGSLRTQDINPGDASIAAAREADMAEHAAQEPDHGPTQAELTPQALPDPQAESTLKALAQDLSPGHQIALVEHALAGRLAEGQEDPGILTKTAQLLGVEPQQASSIIATVRAGFEQQATKAVERLGVTDPEHFWAVAYAEYPKLVQDAVRQQTQNRTTAGYRAVVQAYLSDLARHDPEACFSAKLPAGMSVVRMGGKVIVRHLGGTMEWKSAVNAGLIPLPR